MPVKQEMRGPQQPENNIRWAVPPESLEGLPAATIWNERAVAATVDGNDVAIGVFALPPQETTLSKFWSAVTRKKGSTPERVRLKVEEPIPLSEFQKGEHTRLSAMYPHVVVEDGTRYGIGLWVPRQMFGDWSEPQERDSGDLFGGREVYKQRRVPAVLVRLDGETPLAETKSSSGMRQEVLLGIPEPTPDTEGDVHILISKKHSGGVGRKEDSADVSDLTFSVIAERGTADNAVIDSKGRVQVVLVQATEEHVVEKIPATKMMGLFDSGLSSPSPTYGGDMYNTRDVKETLTGTNSTLRGETRFTGTQRQKVSLKSISNVTPVAELNVVLVGNGGPITAEMTEAQMPQQS